MLHLHRTINYAAGGIVTLLLGAILFISMRSPLVIVMQGRDKHYLQSEHRANPITEKDVENFVRDFLEELFTWEKLAPDSILARVSPLATSGLLDRIKQQLIQMGEKNFKGKVLSEAITNVRVQVTDKEVIASFDKVLRIDGVPLVMPTEMGFNMIQGSETKWNPLGLYVNGLTEHQGPKN